MEGGKLFLSFLPLNPFSCFDSQSGLNGHKNHGMVWVRRDLEDHLAQPLYHGTLWIRFLGALLSLALDTGVPLYFGADPTLSPAGEALVLSMFTGVVTPDCAGMSKARPSMCSKEVIK